LLRTPTQNVRRRNAMKTLETLVLKTATVTGVKLATPADRIGLGLVAIYSTDNLSSGHVLPRNPEPNPVRSRQLSAMQPRMRWRGDDAVPPAGPAGCVPGVPAVRSASQRSNPFTGWHRTTRTAASGGAICLFAAPSRTHVPGEVHHHDRLGRDCQSPDRSGDKWLATRSVSSAATAGK
jgi:hypothetical protein